MFEQFKKFWNVRQIFEILFKWKSYETFFVPKRLKSLVKAKSSFLQKKTKDEIMYEYEIILLMSNFKGILLTIIEILKRIQIFRLFLEHITYWATISLNKYSYCVTKNFAVFLNLISSNISNHGRLNWCHFYNLLNLLSGFWFWCQFTSLQSVCTY